MAPKKKTRKLNAEDTGALISVSIVERQNRSTTVTIVLFVEENINIPGYVSLKLVNAYGTLNLECTERSRFVVYGEEA